MIEEINKPDYKLIIDWLKDESILIIKDGVTKVRDKAFKGFSNIVRISIPNL